MRKKVLAFFKKNPGIEIKAKQLAIKLQIGDDHEYQALKAQLHSLEEDGILGRSGKRFYMITKPEKNITGEFQINKEGYGFVLRPKSTTGDIFISSRHFGTAFHGDIVEVTLFPKKPAKKKHQLLEGQIIKVIKRFHSEIVGKLNKAEEFYYVEPDLPEIHRNIFVTKEHLHGAKIGEVVAVGDIEWDNPKMNPIGKITEKIGKPGTPDVEIISIAREFHLPYKFSSSALTQAGKIKEPKDGAVYPERLDFRNEVVFTIDPDDAKDFDDALSISENEEGNYRIGIHIADVSHYVETGSAIDVDATERGNSVYLVGKVIPMLPEELSNNVCSLVPYKDRLTYSVIAEITPRGKILNYQIAKTVINSKRRYTYDEAQKIIETGEGDFAQEVLKLHKIASIFRNKRMKSGSINFESEEIKFILDPDGKPTGLYKKEMKESNWLVEEFMLLANRLVAESLGAKRRSQDEIPFVYRIHDKPDKDKMKEFARFVKSLGFSFSFSEMPTAKQINDLMASVKGKPEEILVNELAIRSMAKAIYSTTNIGHYGLGFTYYTHFTSPIRRYSDLLVHRITHEYLTTGKKDLYKKEPLEELCDHISICERIAVDAERHSVKRKHVQYMSDFVGHEFDAVISGLTNFGFFVKITETLAEGLVHVRDMYQDYFFFDEKNYLFKGRDTAKTYRLGDKVRVKLIRVLPEKLALDFYLTDN